VYIVATNRMTAVCTERSPTAYSCYRRNANCAEFQLCTFDTDGVSAEFFATDGMPAVYRQHRRNVHGGNSRHKRIVSCLRLQTEYQPCVSLLQTECELRVAATDRKPAVYTVATSK
jgi:hypothetical protein